MMNGMFGGMGFGWIFWIVVLVILIWLAVQFNKNQSNHNLKLLQDTPLNILKKRYVKGEISKEQFDRMKKDLE